jgi:hypothetical protein
MRHGLVMTTNATTAAPLVTRLLHLPITSDAEAFVTVARATERAVVHLGNPGFEHRDRLARFLVRGIETELGRLGAAPPGWKYDDGLEAILGDQLYRARLLGCFGLALSLPSLRDLADGNGQLGAEDSQTLRRLVAVAECEPLQLYLPRPCADLRIFGNPEPLSSWLPASLEPGRVASIEYEGPPSERATSDAAPPESAPRSMLMAPTLEAFVHAHAAYLGETPAPPSVLADGTPSPPSVLADDTPSPPSVVAETPDAPPSVNAQADAVAADQALPPAPASIEPQRVQRCLTWATQLGSMNGPKVHGTVEKAFITAYMPLCREVAAGAAPTEAAAAAERWAEGFAQSYASAFRQFGSRPRRPRMVKDMIDLGVQWLGQHRARQCQLLLVSAMRFDLGQRLNEELERRFAGTAVCADQCVLWAALPSNAEAQQLGFSDETAGRRCRGEATDASDRASGIASFSVGNRGLFKLDHLSSELAKPGEIESARLERLAIELADRVEPWIRSQPPETLVAVFGDHGFYWQATPLGTGAAQRGGALPEQVLVSASAWLLREARHRPRMAPGIH